MTFPSLLEGIGGTVHGSFFRVSDTVDKEKGPGTTPLLLQHRPTTLTEQLLRILTGSYFFYSPNLTWFSIAGVLWILFPYNIQQDWMISLRKRLLINVVVTLCYFGFWHVTLYWLGWGKRPFAANRDYQWSRVIHNMFFTLLGVVQWSFTEAAFLYCYQTRRLSCDQDLDSANQVLCLVLWSFSVPIIRDIHFYLAHRLIHTRFLYRYIHSVHHRNTDIEPFSGLCMHPCEHLYYFTCYAPLLFHTHHPFVLYWMGFHVLHSPAAAHSGYEDHFSASQYHYCHHRYFECNYAGESIMFDKWFGTFRDKLSDADTVDHPRDGKATLLGFPEHFVFQLLGVVVPIAALYYARDIPLHPQLIAVTIAFLPVAAAFFLYRGGKPFSPLDKDTIFSMAFHLVGGVALGILPASYLLSRALG